MLAWYEVLIFMLGGLMVLLITGIPVALAFLGVNIVGAFLVLGGVPGLKQLALNATQSVSTFSLIPIPLFILMGEVLLHSRLAERAIDAIDRLIVGIPGRLSLVAVTGGTAFASLSGSTMANTAMLGKVLMPQMRRLGYHPSIAMGPILATGGIAMLIPPSALAVLLGSLSGISISQLLIAGILPGFLMAVLFFVYIIVRCTLQPELAPVQPMVHEPLRQRIRPFLIYVLPLISIFIVVVVSILGGYATATESAALGSVATFVAAAAYGRLTPDVVIKSLLETGRITSMVLIIIAGSITFSQILSFSGATRALLDIVLGAELSPMMLVLLMLGLLLIMGAFMDQLSMMMITLPFFVPIMEQAGINPVWFGVLMLLALEISLTTPPFGMLLFIMKSVVPPDITMRQVYTSALPFIGLEVLLMTMLIVFPGVALWLPNLIRS